MDTLDPRTPVLVGVGSVTERDGPCDPLELMERAMSMAAADTGVDGLVERAATIVVPRGTWQFSDPGRALARRFGSAARSVLADVGVLQTTLIAVAIREIAAGADVVVVVGGEAAASARRAGEVTAPRPGTGDEASPDSSPDEVLSPHGMVISQLEIARQFWTPAHQYALIERRLGRSPEELDRLWSQWSAVAESNPEAWRRETVTAASLTCGSPTNPAVAHPYGRRHCSQMNVDQAAALVFMSAGAARASGIATDRWVFPWAVAESNHMVPLPSRPDPARSPGFAAVGAALTDATGTALAEIELVDLYSCFPSAVEVQRRELDLDPTRPLTVTGGMSFGGGPFNNYVLQSTARMARLLRERPGDRGLVTAISGMITKQAGVVWSTTPPASPCRVLDVSDVAATAAPSPLVDPADDTASTAVVVSSTVVPEGGAARTWVIGELPSGTRTLVSSADADIATAFTDDGRIGGQITVHGPTFFVT